MAMILCFIIFYLFNRVKETWETRTNIRIRIPWSIIHIQVESTIRRTITSITTEYRKEFFIIANYSL